MTRPHHDESVFASTARAALRLLGVAGACAAARRLLATSPKVEVREPTTVRPPAIGSPVYAAATPTGSNGAIYQSRSFRGLFEDRRARLAGDILTIQIQEKTSRSRARTARSTGRAAPKARSRGAVLKPVGREGCARLDFGAESTNTFEGKGATGTENEFTGTITVTVVEVLAQRQPGGRRREAGRDQPERRDAALLRRRQPDQRACRATSSVRPRWPTPGSRCAATATSTGRRPPAG